MNRSDTVDTRPVITQIRTRIGAEAARLGLPVQVMHTRHRPAGDSRRWATGPTPRAATAYLVTTNPETAADQIVTDWCDAQAATGHTITDTDRAALRRAADSILDETTRSTPPTSEGTDPT